MELFSLTVNILLNQLGQKNTASIYNNVISRNTISVRSTHPITNYSLNNGGIVSPRKYLINVGQQLSSPSTAV